MSNETITLPHDSLIGNLSNGILKIGYTAQEPASALYYIPKDIVIGTGSVLDIGLDGVKLTLQQRNVFQTTNFSDGQEIYATSIQRALEVSLQFNYTFKALNELNAVGLLVTITSDNTALVQPFTKDGRVVPNYDQNIFKTTISTR